MKKPISWLAIFGITELSGILLVWVTKMNLKIQKDCHLEHNIRRKVNINKNIELIINKKIEEEI